MVMSDMEHAPAQALARGVLTMFIVVIAGAVMTSFLLIWTELQESSTYVIVYTVNSLALFIGGWQTSRKISHKGLLYGCYAGIIYILITALIGFLGFSFTFEPREMIFAVIAVLLSGIGGAIGVNLKK
jgi:putative membrane protein (TIGR04086 family)